MLHVALTLYPRSGEGRLTGVSGAQVEQQEDGGRLVKPKHGPGWTRAPVCLVEAMESDCGQTGREEGRERGQ